MSSVCPLCWYTYTHTRQLSVICSFSHIYAITYNIIRQHYVSCCLFYRGIGKQGFQCQGNDFESVILPYLNSHMYSTKNKTGAENPESLIRSGASYQSHLKTLFFMLIHSSISFFMNPSFYGLFMNWVKLNVIIDCCEWPRRSSSMYPSMSMVGMWRSEKWFAEAILIWQKVSWDSKVWAKPFFDPRSSPGLWFFLIPLSFSYFASCLLSALCCINMAKRQCSNGL